MNKCGTKRRPLTAWICMIRLPVGFKLLHLVDSMEHHWMGIACLAGIGPVSYVYDAVVTICTDGFMPVHQYVPVLPIGPSNPSIPCIRIIAWYTSNTLSILAIVADFRTGWLWYSTLAYWCLHQTLS
jgi:hypothetical protein